MDDPYAEVKAHFEDVPHAEVNRGKGSQGIKHNGKMFVMFLKGDLLVKLAPARVLELAERGVGERYDPGTGSFMKDRLLVRRDHSDSWIDICTESFEHVRGA